MADSNDRRNAGAAANITDGGVGQQGAFVPGDHFLVIPGNADVIIYGEVTAPVGAKRPSYLVARCHSAWLSEGATGEVHVRGITAPLTSEEFDRARSAGWPATMRGLIAVLVPASSPRTPRT